MTVRLTVGFQNFDNHLFIYPPLHNLCALFVLGDQSIFADDTDQVPSGDKVEPYRPEQVHQVLFPNGGVCEHSHHGFM